MALKFEFRGYNRVANNLRKMASVYSNIIDPGMKDWAQDVRRKLKGKKYPPARPGQRYVRTGQLANRWKVTQQKSGVVFIENLANHRGKFYANYPVGDHQAWMHKGRWWKARDIINEETPGLVKKLTELIKSIWNG